MPDWAYFASFAVAIYAGAIVTLAVRRIPSESVQALWFSFGAFSILDSGVALADDGLTTPVLLGFVSVWAILLGGEWCEWKASTAGRAGTPGSVAGSLVDPGGGGSFAPGRWCGE